MEEDNVRKTFQYPVHINTFAIPNDPSLRREHEVYKPSEETKYLQSEQGRTVYPELFIENYNLGTLVDLCVRVLARSLGAIPLPIVASQSRLLQVHYDALDIEMPLAQCYHINEERFWKRLVLAKHQDKSLILQHNINWKNIGVTLKFVDLVESCPAEYWPEEEIKDLALKIKDYVNEMHIKRLQSLQERSFEKYFQSESESSSEESDEQSDEDESDSSVPTSVEEEEMGEEEEDEIQKTESQLEFEKEEARKKALRKRIRQEIREAKQKAKEAREAKRMKRATKRARKHTIIENIVKKIPKNPKNVFNIPILESEDDGDDQIIDKRNPSLFLAHLKRYDYPAEHCHHIDLRFVQYFTNLETFTIEFWGPLQQRNYHKRHRNFSHQDIKHLAAGLSHLPNLKVFRLRNSRMDTEKLLTLCRSLAKLDSLRDLDFGNDQLNDDCGFVFVELFEITRSVINLELESNNLGLEALSALGKALRSYRDASLEYLGLARNPVNDEALHALISTIIGTKHVNHLNIRGLKYVTEAGICCCLAQELLTQHEPLIKLNICAIPISPLAADEIVKAFTKNTHILEFYCCACELDDETDIDINVLLQRNKYISENYFVGNDSVPNEEIEQWVNRVKNPILLNLLAEKEKHQECLQNLPTQFIPSPAVSATSLGTSHDSLDPITQMYGKPHRDYDSDEESQTSKMDKQKFVYPANEFDEEQFLEHVAQPGPRQRYYYFKDYKEKYYIKENIKNISMI